MDAAAGVNQGNGFAPESGAAKIPERLEKRHKARVEDAERRKEAKESQSVAEEKEEYFFSTFNTELASIEQLLSSCSGAEQAVVMQILEEATAKTVQLQKFVNDSMLFLTQYQLRKTQAALQKLQTSLLRPERRLSPRKIQVDGAAASEQCGFSNMSDEYLTKTSEEIQKRDVLLTHLTNCKVRLFGSPSTLHLKHIDGCEILCGPVSSSVFVDHCTNSTLVFPCQQLRTHNTTDTQVYLHVTSRAIIEDCHGVSFAPFSWSYPNLEDDFSVSGLDMNRNNWSQVDDFNWLAAGTPSPNWTTIPEADRKTHWDP
ncbi:hypothetical protein Q5P01_023566 [Channa striata]|uniref:Tubulin-specific chaperone C n=1 Tax=Channa striata TaxID=64152 RepID=A0AA88LQH8_CHASR|nr:hypothetical protein Q5P01_023566 [Channa striata]